MKSRARRPQRRLRRPRPTGGTTRRPLNCAQSCAHHQTVESTTGKLFDRRRLILVCHISPLPFEFSFPQLNNENFTRRAAPGLRTMNTYTLRPDRIGEVSHRTFRATAFVGIGCRTLHRNRCSLSLRAEQRETKYYFGVVDLSCGSVNQEQFRPQATRVS
jgi:hypothetical protein